MGLTLGILYTALFVVLGTCQDDSLGISKGFSKFSTKNLDFEIVKQSQTLASLRPAGQTFDFSPYDYLQYRARDGQYHLGDITFRYRLVGDTAWTSDDSAARRAAVKEIAGDKAFAASDLGATFQKNTALSITRSWSDLAGDLALRFTLKNTAQKGVEIGSLGLPIEFNSIFTNRRAEDTQAKCSLHDPYIGLDAGFIRVTPVSGNGPSLVVTPLNGTRFEGWRNLAETSYTETQYGSQTFEGFYEWQVYTKAYAENEWKNTKPWNAPTSKTLQPGESLDVGLRFSLAKGGVADIENTVKSVGIPYVVGAPGYVVPQDLTAKLAVSSTSKVSSLTTEPKDAFQITAGTGSYSLKPSSSAWGRVRLTIAYEDGRTQAVHYFITKPGPSVLADLGRFSTTSQWFNTTSDPFGRAPSVMTYDRELNRIVDQDPRAWMPGLSDEGGAGSYLAAVVKQFAQPNVEEVAKLELFIDKVLWRGVQNQDFSVKKSLFFYEPAAVPNYKYRTDIDWRSWTSWNKAASADTGRAYNYVHVAASYWAMYRVARAHPEAVTLHDWQWYLSQAYKTIFALMKTNSRGQTTVGYALVGLMGETVFGSILTDLYRENYTAIADQVKGNMTYRASRWDKEAVPFGSEMAWDSTGQEGVYYWSKYFSYSSTAQKSLKTVQGFTPLVPHWSYAGNSRRYWDNIYAGKLRRIERQIHHYGSALNSLVLLSHFRSNPKEIDALRTGYSGMMGAWTNIDERGASSASFHAWPDTLVWDGYSGDYGVGFAGMVQGSGCYVAGDRGTGWSVFGGESEDVEGGLRVRPRDAIRRRVYVGGLGALVETDRGVVEEVVYRDGDKRLEIALGQVGIQGVPVAKEVVVWVSKETAGGGTFDVQGTGVTKARGGWLVPLSGGKASIVIVAKS